MVKFPPADFEFKEAAQFPPVTFEFPPEQKRRLLMAVADPDDITPAGSGLGG